MKAYIKNPNQPGEVREILNTLEQLQVLVRGYIEPVHFVSDRSIVGLVNEEGALMGMERNVMGLSGPLVIVGVKGEEFTDLTEEQIQFCKTCIK